MPPQSVPSVCRKLMALAFLTHNGKLICAQSYVTLCTLPSSTSDPPLHAHGLGAAADWTWRGKLDLVCVMDLVCM